MEILIIGGLLVALMVYLSTKIKRVAKEAYEKETHTGKDFWITKPVGFIIPIKEDSPFVFETNCKDFGEADESEHLYQAWATIEEKKANSENEVLSKGNIVIEGITVKYFCKTLVSNISQQILELRVYVLPEYLELYQEQIDTLVNSFRVKS